MKPAHVLLLAAGLMGGCVNLPPGWQGETKVSAKVTVTAPQPEKSKPVRAEDVSEANAHDMATALDLEISQDETGPAEKK